MQFINFLLSRLKESFLSLAASAPASTRDCWVLLDHVSSPRHPCIDNWELYKYLCTKEELIGKVFYLINEKAVEKLPQRLSPIEREGLIVIKQNGTLPIRLYLILFRLKFWLDSYQDFYWLGLSKYLKSFKGFSIYTQHGINVFKTEGLRNVLISDIYFDSVICSSEDERSLLKEYYLYRDEQLPVIGLPRWAPLLKKRKNNKNRTKISSIFVYLTYRDYFGGSVELVSKYLQTINNLVRRLTESGFQVFLSFHHMCPRDFFKFNKDVRLINDDQIATIKEKADALITDFSSMCFDFALLGKPTFFYLFDLRDRKKMPLTDQGNLTRAQNVLKNYGYATELNELENIIKCYINQRDSLTFAEYYLKNNGGVYSNLICEDLYKSINNLPNQNIKPKQIPEKIYLLPAKSYQEYKFDWRNPIYTSGLGGIESNDKGVVYRWGVGDTYLIIFRVGRGRWKIAFDIAALLNKFQRANKAKVFVNGNKIDSWSFDFQNNRGERTLELSVQCETDVIVKIVVSKARSPKMLQINDDRRDLGLQFFKISFLNTEIEN